MNKSNKLKIFNPSILFLSFLGTGFFPKAPGTFASFCTIPLLYLVGSIKLSLFWHISIILFLTIVASCLAQIVQRKEKLHDPQWIVIDEVIGMFVTFSFSPNITYQNLLIIFILFRIFDIIKIWPASYFDKKINHGFGTIFDDVISGAYAGMSLLLLKVVLPTIFIF